MSLCRFKRKRRNQNPSANINLFVYLLFFHLNIFCVSTAWSTGGAKRSPSEIRRPSGAQKPAVDTVMSVENEDDEEEEEENDDEEDEDDLADYNDDSQVRYCTSYSSSIMTSIIEPSAARMTSH